MARQSLPDPQWTAFADLCIGCGYPLAGLPAPGRCPECGTPYGSRQLVVAGVPRRSGGHSPVRRLAWVGLIAGTIAHAYSWPLQFFFIGWPLPLAVTSALIAGLLLLLLSGPRERRGSERFSIAGDRLVRLPLNFEPGSQRLDSVTVDLRAADAVDLIRISPTWRRLRIGRRLPNGKLTDVLFDAGIRCPDPDAEMLRAEVERALGPPSQPTP